MTENIINRVLDPETLKKLSEAGALGFTENKDFIYVPKSVRKKNDDGEYIIPKENWPVFKLRGKDGVESANMEGKLGNMQVTEDANGNQIQSWVSKSGPQRIETLVKGVRGWNNYFDSNGNQIVFRENNGTVRKDAIALIPSAWAMEFANAIIDRTVLSSEEMEGLEF